MYKCLDCGMEFEAPSIWTEPHGEEVSGCPTCGGAYEKLKECEACMRLCLKEELHNGLCESCIMEYEYDLPKCLEIGEKNKEEIKINGFLAYFFSENEIEEILKKELEETAKIIKINCSEYIENDIDEFAKLLKKTAF